MRFALPLPLLSGLWAASFALVVHVAAGVQERIAVRPVGIDVIYKQDDENADQEQEQAPGQSKTYQRLRKSPQAYMADYGFTNFNRDFLTIHYQLPKRPYEEYINSWGYSTAYLDNLKTWSSQARDAALKTATAKHETQAQFNQDLAAIEVQYNQKVKDYMASKSFRFLSGKDKEVEVDMPKVIRDNSVYVKSLSQAFDQVATQKRYDSGNLIGAVASMVQTAIIYWVMPPVVGTVHNGGFWPPLQTLMTGRGDCITKTGVLASVLANFPQMRMVGLALPGHYLMAILRIPNKGDLFVEYQGLQYVLVEPAGPAWLTPGSVGEHTQILLEASQGYRIEPFF
jgi:hypothetical protein